MAPITLFLSTTVIVVRLTTLVDIDFTEYRKKVDNKSVRRNVTIPNWLNREAAAAHINVSRVLQEALKEKLNLA